MASKKVLINCELRVVVGIAVLDLPNAVELSRSDCQKPVDWYTGVQKVSALVFVGRFVEPT